MHPVEYAAFSTLFILTIVMIVTLLAGLVHSELSNRATKARGSRRENGPTSSCGGSTK